MVTDVWVQSQYDYLFVPAVSAQLVADPRQPAVAWLQLALTFQGYSGAVLGYRVTATAPRDAFGE